MVTASGGMMGASIAVALAGAGYDLVLNDRRDGTLPPVEERVRELGAAATSVLTDVSTREGAHAVVGAALERWGTVDVLVNVAGGLKGPLHN
ncbi:MAG: SDR family NAD(P)-dependent oxidoreductase, partial [Acidimicrobiia bacterium]